LNHSNLANYIGNEQSMAAEEGGEDVQAPPAEPHIRSERSTVALPPLIESQNNNLRN